MTAANILEVMDTFHIFWDLVSFSEEEGEGWEILIYSADQATCVSGEHRVRCDFLSWIIRVAGPDVKENFIEQRYNQLLGWLADLKHEDILRSFLQLVGKEAINCRESTEGYSALLRRIAYAEDDLEFILRNKPDLHITGYDMSFSNDLETPTSLALYSSWSFGLWRDGLYKVGVNLEEFVIAEMQQAPLVEAGWTAETLLAVFDYDYEPDWDLDYLWICDDCEDQIENVRVQPYWLHKVERIRSCLDPDSVSEGQLATIWEAWDETVESDGELKGSGALEDDENDSWPTGSSYSPDLGEQSEPMCAYRRDDVICMDCWLHYQETGHHLTSTESEDEIDSESNTDEPSDDEYSPFLIHT